MKYMTYQVEQRVNLIWWDLNKQIDRWENLKCIVFRFSGSPRIFMGEPLRGKYLYADRLGMLANHDGKRVTNEGFWLEDFFIQMSDSIRTDSYGVWSKRKNQ